MENVDLSLIEIESEYILYVALPVQIFRNIRGGVPLFYPLKTDTKF